MAKKRFKKTTKKHKTQQITELNHAKKLFSQGHFTDALPAYAKLLAKQQDNPDLLFHMGYTYYACKQYEKATKTLQQLLEISPEHENGRRMLIASLNDGGMTDAMLSMAHLIKEKPLNDGEYLQAFSAFLSVCDWDNALPMLKRCVNSILVGNIPAALLPGFLMDILGLNEISCDIMFSLTQKAAELNEHNIRPLPINRKKLSINNKIKVAYLSTDLRAHPVGYFIYSILSAHDKSRFEIYCYAASTIQDNITELIREESEYFIDVSNLNEEEIAQRIHKDGIHVLIELGGYTESSKLKTMAYRPAPVSIEYLGYANSTGYKTIDFRITDPFVDVPDGTKYTETLLTLPKSFICFGMRPSCPRLEQAPVSKNGFITFGSFNHSRKLNPQIIEAWSNILNSVSNSRLVLKGNWKDGAISNNILEAFNTHGIKTARIIFLSHTETYDDHVACYNEIDIALDTFPYTGTTTTCEALWMGVPVITIVGKSHQSRVSYSILKNIGFEETICNSIDEYIKKAVQMANNIDGLSILRPMLHTLFCHSPVTQPQTMIPQLEELYLDACARKGITLNQNASAKVQSISAAESSQISNNVRKLHIGGKEKHAEWEILDAIPSDLTDHVGNANDLSMFADNTFEAIYSSHVLEHFSYQSELSQVLAEWYRVLKPGGIIFASVPNLDVLCELFLNKAQLSGKDRFLIMRMMFGGQVDPYDFHKVGYNPEILGSYLAQVGFENIHMVSSFGLFNDTSNMKFADTPISLNVTAKKPAENDYTTSSSLNSQQTKNNDKSESHHGKVSDTEAQNNAPLEENSDTRITLATLIAQASGNTTATIIEIGARIIGDQNGVASELFHHLKHAKVLAFEADSEACDQINTITKNYPADISAYPYALGEKKATQTLYVTQEGMCSSLYKPNEKLVRLFEGMEVSYLKEEIPIDVISLDEFMQIEKIKDADFIKIDVQGAELDVFKGAELALQNIIGICTEVEWSELYEEQPLFADVDQYLRAHGFQLHHLLGVGTRPLRGNKAPGCEQYLWSDAIYFPPLERIKTLSADKLIKLAMMATLYDAHDLSLFALKRFDALQGSDLTTTIENCLNLSV